jgi:deoxyhypusine synthase
VRVCECIVVVMAMIVVEKELVMVVVEKELVTVVVVGGGWQNHHTLQSRMVSNMSPGSHELSAPYTRTTSRDACDGRALSRFSASINEFWIDA